MPVRLGGSGENQEQPRGRNPEQQTKYGKILKERTYGAGGRIPRMPVLGILATWDTLYKKCYNYTLFIKRNLKLRIFDR